MATDDTRLIISLEARIAQFERSMAKATAASSRATGKIQTDFAKLERRFSSFGGAGLRGFLGPLTAALGAGALFKNFITETVAAQNALAQLDAVLKSTGGAAGLTSAQAQELASSLQSVTTFGDEAIISAENLLLSFTKIGKDVFPATVEAVLDISTALGQDLKSSATQLGKALQDPVRGITALRRVGVDFSDGQKEVIKNLVETGRQAEAQKLILQELQEEYGGSARAARDTLGGALQALSNAWSDLFEMSGTATIDLQDAIEDLVDTITDPEFKGAVVDIGTGLIEGFRFAATEVQNFIRDIQQLKAELQGIAGAVSTFFDGLVVSGPAESLAAINDEIAELEKAIAAGAGSPGILREQLQLLREEADRTRASLATVLPGQTGAGPSFRQAEDQSMQRLSRLGRAAPPPSLGDGFGDGGGGGGGASAVTAAAKAQADALRSLERAQDTHLRALEAGIQDSQEQLQQFGAIGQSVFSSLVSGLTSGASAAETLSNSLRGLLDQLANLAINSLFGALFGGGLSPAAGALGRSGFGGLFAGGGTLGAGKWGIAGEHGPEIVRGPAQIVPMGKAGQPRIDLTVNVAGARGNTEIRQMVGEGLQQGLAEYDRFKARQQLRAG